MVENPQCLGNYEKMANFVSKINVNNMEGSFLRAVLGIRNNQFEYATNHINRVRDMLDSELTSMAAESYERVSEIPNAGISKL